MRFLVPILMLVFCGCPKPQSAAPSATRSQEAIAREIVTIAVAFGNALTRDDDARCAAEVESLAGRLDMISKELDRLGPLPPTVREATAKEIDNPGRIFTVTNRIPTVSARLPEAQKLLENAGTRYFVAWGSVMDKAGLDIPVHPNDRENNKPSRTQ
jgi:hypothetical protein